MNRSCLTVLLLASAAWSAEPPKFSTPEPDFPADDLRGPGPDDKTYPLPQDAELSKKLFERRRKFTREQFLGSYDASPAATAKGGAEGKAALEAAAEYFASTRVSNWAGTKLERYKDTLKAAIKAGCSDPIVRYQHTAYCELGEIPVENAESLAECDAELEKAKASVLMRIWCKLDQATSLLKADTTKAKKDARKAVDDGIRLCGDLAQLGNPDADYFIYHALVQFLNYYQSAGWKRSKGYELVGEALHSGSECLKKSVEARSLIDAAWEARGTRTAANTTDEQMAEFKEILKSASAAAQEAWKADRSSPIAPALMITICMGQGTKRSTMEEWFNRAMSADPNYVEACSAKVTYLEPKWQGSIPELLTFGRQCMRTKNYEANLPFMLLVAHNIMSKGALLQHIKTHDAAWADVREVYECALQVRPTDRQLLCEYALLCEAVGQFEAAQKHLKAVNGKFWEPSFKNKAAFDAAVKRIDEKLKKEKDKKP